MLRLSKRHTFTHTQKFLRNGYANGRKALAYSADKLCLHTWNEALPLTLSSHIKLWRVYPLLFMLFTQVYLSGRKGFKVNSATCSQEFPGVPP